MKKKIGELLTGKVSPLGMFIGSLVVCIIVAGAVAKASNDNITVNNGGTLNITNQASDISNQENIGGTNGYSVDMVSSPYVTANFPGDVSVVGNETITGTLGVTGALTSSATSTFTGNLQAARVFMGGSAYSSSTSKNFTLAAATICDNNKVSISFVSSTADSVAITMPATSSVSSYCLKTVGQELYLNFINSSSFASSTVLTANTDWNFYYNATGTTINGSKLDTVRCRRGSTAYDCTFAQYPVR